MGHVTLGSSFQSRTGCIQAAGHAPLEVQHPSFIQPEHQQELTVTPLGDTGTASRYSYEMIPRCTGMRWQHAISSLPLSTFLAFTSLRLKMQFSIFSGIIHRTVWAIWGLGRWKCCHTDPPCSTDRTSTCPLHGLQ